MKKIIALMLLLLVNVPMVLAPEDKAEKLRVNGNDWDRDGQQFVVSMSCKFGIATAGERAGFSLRVTVDITADGKTYSEKGVNGISKVEDASKDQDGYIAVEPTKIAWDRGGFTGDAGVTTSIQLVGPSGNEIGDPVSHSEVIEIEPQPPGEPPDGDDTAS